jgi:ATP-dependent Clp protease ATP-binding subunit ClpB
MDVVEKHFRPEFINRLDECIVFHPLDRTQLESIANIQIERLRQRLGGHDIKLVLTKLALEYLTAEGYDVVYGARPLKRAIQQLLENPLAKDLLEGKFMPGDTAEVRVDKDKGLIFEKKKK